MGWGRDWGKKKEVYKKTVCRIYRREIKLGYILILIVI